MTKLQILELFSIIGLVIFLTIAMEHSTKLTDRLIETVRDQQSEIELLNYKLRESLYIGQSYDNERI
jgi:hypothetical protein